MRERRRALKSDPRVLAALKAWWNATDVDKSGTIELDEFTELLKSIYRVKVSDTNEVRDVLGTVEPNPSSPFFTLFALQELK